MTQSRHEREREQMEWISKGDVFMIGEVMFWDTHTCIDQGLFGQRSFINSRWPLLGKWRLVQATRFHSIASLTSVETKSIEHAQRRGWTRDRWLIEGLIVDANRMSCSIDIFAESSEASVCLGLVIVVVVVFHTWARKWSTVDQHQSKPVLIERITGRDKRHLIERNKRKSNWTKRFISKSSFDRFRSFDLVRQIATSLIYIIAFCLSEDRPNDSKSPIDHPSERQRCQWCSTSIPEDHGDSSPSPSRKWSSIFITHSRQAKETGISCSKAKTQSIATELKVVVGDMQRQVTAGLTGKPTSCEM